MCKKAPNTGAFFRLAHGATQRRKESAVGNRLYVGNLGNDVTEAEIEEFFGVYGTVVSVRIKRDSVTGEPWGYGFVEMEDPTAAEAALKNANGKMLKQQKLKIDPLRSF